jgi:hypothetical protein
MRGVVVQGGNLVVVWLLRGGAGDGGLGGEDEAWTHRRYAVGLGWWGRGGSGGGGFDDGDFVGGELVEVVDELVDAAVGGVDFAVELLASLGE